MRFYKNRQADMLKMVSFLLKQEQDAVSAKVPALRNFISEFLEKQKKLEMLLANNPNAVSVETWQKISVKDAFAEATMKLLGVVKAANYGKEKKQADKVDYTIWRIKKLSAADMCKLYLDTEKKVKKIRNLPFYGLSTGDMHDAREYYKEFAARKNAPAKRKKEVASKNKQLNDLVKECIDLLTNTIDPLMLLATEANKELAYNYKSKRIVMSKGQGRPSDAEAAYRKSRQGKKV